MKAVTFVSLADISNMPVASQDEIGKKYVTGVKANKEKAETLREEAKNVSKLLFVYSQRLARGKEAGVFSSDKTLDDIWRDSTGASGKIPGHLYSLKYAVGAFVDKAFENFQEADYDRQSSNVLQKFGQAIKLAGSYDHPTLAKMATIMATAPHKEIAAMMTAALDTLRPPQTEEEANGEIMKALDAYVAARPNGLPFIVAYLKPLFKNAGPHARTEAFVKLCAFVGEIEETLDAEMQAEITAKLEAQKAAAAAVNAPLTITAGGTATEAEKAAAPETATA